MTKATYSSAAVERSRQSALDWLDDNASGYPRTWEQERKNDARRDEDLYDDFEAPPIAGYEALESDGIVHRLGTVFTSRQERVHFQKVSQTRDDT